MQRRNILPLHACTMASLSSKSNDIGNYLDIRSDRNDKLEGMNHDSPLDVVRIVPENMPDMCVGEFGVSLPSVMYTHKRLRVDPSLFC